MIDGRNKSFDEQIIILEEILRKNDKLIRETEVHSFDEFSKNIVVEEKYNSLADYEIHVEYKTPLGDEMKHIYAINTYN